MILSEIFAIIDNGTWKYVPNALKTVINRDHWLKMLSAYTALVLLMIYRLVVIERTYLFHSSSPTRSTYATSSQLKELLVHLIFFFVPGYFVFAFATRRDQTGSE
jgi:hypothetical protein